MVRTLELDPILALSGAIDSASVTGLIDSFRPQAHIYHGLMAALAEYRALQATGGWPDVPDGETLKPGMQDPRVVALRRRLAVTGDMPADPLPTQDLVWHQRLTTVSVDGFCQWRKDAAEIAGATADVYRVEAVSGADAGVYDVIIDNGCGTAVSDPVCVWVSSPGLSPWRLGPVAHVPPDPNSPIP